MVGSLCAFSARNCLAASFEAETAPLVNPNENAAAGPSTRSGGAPLLPLSETVGCAIQRVSGRGREPEGEDKSARECGSPAAGK